MLNRTIPICIEPGGVPEIIYVSQYDEGFQTYEFVPYVNNGTLSIPTNATVTLEGTKPDGYAFIHNCTYNSSTGHITYTVQDQLAAKAGRVWSKLVIRDTSGNVLGFRAIVWIVDFAGVKDGAVVSDSDLSALEEFVNEFGTINTYKSELDGVRAAVGGPLAASTVAEMTDRTRVYVYTGSETGYTEGHWYYWDGSAWTDGGVYQAMAIETDKTLTVANMAADAKATGDAIAAETTARQNAVTELENDLDEDFDDAFEKGIVMLFNRYNTTDGFIMTSGEVRASTTLCYSDYVSVVAGKTIYFSDNGVLNVARFVTAYDANKNVLSDKGLDYGNTYIVPDNVAYIRVTFLKSYTAFQAQYDRVTDTRSYRIIKEDALPDSVIDVLADTEKIKNNTDYLIENTISKVTLVDNGDINTGVVLGADRRWFYANAIPANAIIDDITFKAASNYTNGKNLLLEFWEERTAGTLTKVDEIRYIPASANAVCTIPLDGRITLYPTYISFLQGFSVLLLTQGSNPNVKYTQDNTSSSIAISALNDFNGDLDIDLSYHVYSGGSDGNVVHVGNGYAYTEIQDALDAITDDSAENPYTIIVHPKSVPYTRFSTLRRLSGAYPWTNAPIRYISIIGLDRYHCVVQDDKGNYSTPPAEILINGLVKNMTFVATHNDQDATATQGAYAVHIDAEPVGNVGYDMQFEDCVFKSDQTAGVGIGLHNACHLSFNNCDFISTASESYAPHDGYTNLAYLGAFNCHSSTNASDTDQVIKLTNCRAISKENKAYNLSTSVDSYMTLMAFDNTFWCEGTAQANGYKGSYCTIYGANHGNNASALNA